MGRALSLSMLVLSGLVWMAYLPARSQDSPPSLGAVARQARLQKQQKDAQSDKDSSASTSTANKDSTGKDSTPVPVSKDSLNQGPGTAAKNAPKDGQPKTKHVVTNDEIPEHIGPTSTRPSDPVMPPVYYSQPSGNGAADQWKQQILSMKSYISNMQSQIANMEQSVNYADGNRISNRVQWNERQQQKQQQAEMMKLQLEQMQKRLEEMQEMARQQGFGGSVYDP